MIIPVAVGAKLFAAIGVSYPAGSTLTCTKGTKTLKAENTSGQWVFAVPEAGAWIVTTTNGTATKSQKVEITGEGQCVNITLNYELVLFENSVTSGWEVKRYTGMSLGKASISDGKIVMDGENAAVDMLFYKTETVDTSGYTYAKITIDSMSLGDGSARLVLQSNPEVAQKDSPAAASINMTSAGLWTLRLPTTGTYYIGIIVRDETTLTASKIWLE